MSDEQITKPLLALPVGTQVVTRILVATIDGTTYPRGSVAVIVVAPQGDEGRYRVRFLDGGEAFLARAELAVRKHFQVDGLRDAAPALNADLDHYIIYRCVVGSQAYGLAEEESDVDRRGIYLPPAALHWSLGGVPEQIEHKGREECYCELQKFLVLALKANPNLLECLYTPLVENATPLAQELLAMRHIFLSRLVYQTYNGYVLSQFKKLEQDMCTAGAIKWKHAMHLIRLLLSGAVVLREGFVPLRVDAHREQLLAIRRGELPWPVVDAWRLALHREFEAAFAQTTIPERPDYAAANAFLLRARRSMVEHER